MTPQAARETYKRALGKCETILIRRYSGTGSPRSSVESACQARVIGGAASTLVGIVQQGNSQLIVLAEDLESGNVSLPLLISDKAVVRGKEMAIVSVDDDTRRVGSTLCAYVLEVRG